MNGQIVRTTLDDTPLLTFRSAMVTDNRGGKALYPTSLCLPSRSWYSFTDPVGMEG